MKAGVCGRQLNHKHAVSTIKERQTDRWAERNKITETTKQSLTLVRGDVFFCDSTVSCPRGAHRGQRQPRSDVREAWQRLNSVALHHVSREMRGCRAWPGVRGQDCALSELRSNYRRLNPLTYRRVMKGFADSFETPRRGYLFVSVRLLKLEQREEEGGRRTSVRLIFARESCEELWKQHASPFAFFCLLIAEALSVTQHFHEVPHK